MSDRAVGSLPGRCQDTARPQYQDAVDRTAGVPSRRDTGALLIAAKVLSARNTGTPLIALPGAVRAFRAARLPAAGG
ncbi:hypothetical protein [Streptosporangium sp. 'caverna']|uniref:hypothetical protein n=1 Tax=Streptosporangium sp. 'caverna' TaxID=2202249 RepID=UPI0013A6E6D9|nr:hypothetical protein [Streptosporangium sp. 'caverna']